MFQNQIKIKGRMKPPFNYYGGKQNMIDKILPLITEHKLYCEPFAGGAAIFFAKNPSAVEIINDTNKELINFYAVTKNRFVDLENMVRVTLHSRSLFNDASTIYNSPHLFSEVKRAWAVWTLGAQGFSGMLDGSWGYTRQKSTVTKNISAKRDRFTEDFAVRLQNTQIECADALYVVQSRDFGEAFFYIDPPYYNSDMGHYDGYTRSDFEKLLVMLGSIKGKFLLSSYDSDILQHYTKLNGWKSQKHEYKVSVNAKSGKLKNKVEVLTMNYEVKEGV